MLSIILAEIESVKDRLGSVFMVSSNQSVGIVRSLQPFRPRSCTKVSSSFLNYTRYHSETEISCVNALKIFFRLGRPWWSPALPEVLVL